MAHSKRSWIRPAFATREGDDYAARVYVLLDYPLDSLSFATRQKLRLARTFFDPDLPAATLSYVWDNRAAPGTHARSAYTETVEMIVLRGPEARWASGRASRGTCARMPLPPSAAPRAKFSAWCLPPTATTPGNRRTAILPRRSCNANGAVHIQYHRDTVFMMDARV
jgi:hypothetical protein